MRSAPVPNIPPIPGMCPSMAVLAGGGDVGTGGNGSGDGTSGGSGEGGGGSGDAASADSRGALDGSPEATCVSDPVDVVTGKVFTFPCIDFVLAGPIELVFERRYSSKLARSDFGLGRGWCHTFGWSLEVRRDKLSITNDQGVVVDFPLLEQGEQHIGSWGWLLRRDASGYQLDIDDGLFRDFEAAAEGSSFYRLARVRDRSKNQIRLTYDRNALVEIVDSAGRSIRVRTAPPNANATTLAHIQSFEVKNAAEQGKWILLSRYDIDDRGDLVAFTDADNFTARFTYDDRHLLVEEIKRTGLVFHYVYDRQGRCTEAWGEHKGGAPDPSLADGLPKLLADGKTKIKGIHHVVLEYGIDSSTTVYDSTQTRTFFGNRHGLIDKRVDGGGVTTCEYDDHGFIRRRTNAIGATVQFERDERGRVLKVVEGDGRVTKFDRNADGLIVRETDPAGRVHVFERDLYGNVVLYTDPAGAPSKFTHDERGLLREIRDASGGRTVHEYDAHGNMVRETKPNGAVWQYAYDWLGRLVGRTDPHGAVTRTVYSDRGDVISEYDALGGIDRYVYDGEGRLVREIAASGRVTDYVWGGVDRLCEKKTADNVAVRLRYNWEGELLKVEKGALAHSFELSPNGRVVGETTLAGEKISYKRDPIGRITHVRCGSETTELVYAPSGELLSRKNPDGSTDEFEYDRTGYLMAARSGRASFRYERDGMGRVVREIQGLDDSEHHVDSAYDSIGRRIERRTSLGHAERIVRDRAGLRVKTELGPDFEIEHLSDASGREIARRFASGASVESEFDLEGRLALRRVLGTGGAQRPHVGDSAPQWAGPGVERGRGERRYGYDLDGELISITDPKRGATRIDYDPVGRLLAMVPPDARPHLTSGRGDAKSHSFAYDASGRMTEVDGQSCRYEGARLVQKGNVSYRWDEQGRLLERREENDGKPAAVTKYEWGGIGLLKRMTLPDGRMLDFTYDALARRLEKRVLERGIDGKPRAVAITRFVWDGGVLVHEVHKDLKAKSNDYERTFCFEEDSYEPALQRVRKTDDVAVGDWYSFVNDPSGAPERMIDSQGTVVAEFERTPFGVAPTQSSKVETPLRLQGQYEDSESGLAYNRFRYYDPDSGTYISPDPLALGGGTNPYGLGDNTLGWVDPLGLVPGAPVILGENMKDRVTPTANSMGGHTFQVRSKYKWNDTDPPDVKAVKEKAWEKNQKRWMRDQIDAGRPIYDIGIDPTRSNRSKYCKIEHDVLKEEGFTRVCRGTTMVNGVSTPLYEWVPPPGFKPGDGKKRRQAARKRKSP
ncbi:MAG: RHS repeat-associated core domain-containing protein [Polyangiaceae bacterium]